MQLSLLASAAAAGLAGLARADSPSNFNLAKSFEDYDIYHGTAALATAQAPAVSLDLSLPEAQIQGDLGIVVGAEFLTNPTVKISLAGIKAYVEVKVAASAAVRESVELFVYPKLDADVLNLLDVELEAGLALDLILCLDAAVDLTAGVYIEFPADAYFEISLIDSKIVDSKLDGLQTKAIPIGLGASVDLSVEVNLEIALRLRALVGIKAAVGIAGLSLVNGAVEVALALDLFDYTAVLVTTPSCLLFVSENILVRLGLAVNVDVEVLDVLSLDVAPALSIKLAETIVAGFCQPGGGKTDPTDPDPKDPKPSSSAGVVLAPTPPASVPMMTSTKSQTNTYTVTSCAVNAPVCPSNQTQVVVTETVTSTKITCPVGQSATPEAPSAKEAIPVVTVTRDLTKVVPCNNPQGSYFIAPTDAPQPEPTVTIPSTGASTPVPSAAAAAPQAKAPVVASPTPAPTPAPTPSAVVKAAPSTNSTGTTDSEVAAGPDYGYPVPDENIQAIASPTKRAAVVRRVVQSAAKAVSTGVPPAKNGTQANPAEPIAAAPRSVKMSLFAFALPVIVVAMF